MYKYPPPHNCPWWVIMVAFQLAIVGGVLLHGNWPCWVRYGGWGMSASITSNYDAIYRTSIPLEDLCPDYPYLRFTYTVNCPLTSCHRSLKIRAL